VHISAFGEIVRRPLVGDPVVFRRTMGGERPKVLEAALERVDTLSPEARIQGVASAVRPSYQHHGRVNTRQGRNKRYEEHSLGWHTPGSYIALLLIMMVLVGVAVGFWPVELLWLYIGVSLVTFFAYLLDKRAAMRGAWRTPERTLQLLGLMGGWPGGYLAQRLLRHKCSKRSFQVEFWMTVVGNLALQTWLFSRYGQQLLSLFQA
ncbi:MAG: DUF1294 domain-containing protein, partial [Aeromonadaceae bacterium]